MPKYPEKMREMITETIRQNIHSAAIELIREQGWNAFTTEKIAEKVGVSRGVLYNYFKNKEAIAESIIHTSFDKMLERLQVVADNGKPASERILEMAEISVSNFLSQRELHRTIMKNMPPPEKRKRKNPPPPLLLVKAFSKVITEGIEAGEFIELDVNSASKLLTGGLHEICIHSFFENDEQAVKPLVDIFLRGIRK